MDGKKALRVIEGLLAIVGYSDEIEVLKLTVKALADKKIDKEEFKIILSALESCVTE